MASSSAIIPTHRLLQEEPQLRPSQAWLDNEALGSVYKQHCETHGFKPLKPDHFGTYHALITADLHRLSPEKHLVAYERSQLGPKRVSELTVPDERRNINNGSKTAEALHAALVKNSSTHDPDDNELYLKAIRSLRPVLIDHRTEESLDLDVQVKQLQARAKNNRDLAKTLKANERESVHASKKVNAQSREKHDSVQKYLKEEVEKDERQASKLEHEANVCQQQSRAAMHCRHDVERHYEMWLTSGIEGTESPTEAQAHRMLVAMDDTHYFKEDHPFREQYYLSRGARVFHDVKHVLEEHQKLSRCYTSEQFLILRNAIRAYRWWSENSAPHKRVHAGTGITSRHITAGLNASTNEAHLKAEESARKAVDHEIAVACAEFPHQWHKNHCLMMTLFETWFEMHVSPSCTAVEWYLHGMSIEIDGLIMTCPHAKSKLSEDCLLEPHLKQYMELYNEAEPVVHQYQRLWTAYKEKRDDFMERFDKQEWPGSNDHELVAKDLDTQGALLAEIKTRCSKASENCKLKREVRQDVERARAKAHGRTAKA